LVIFPRACSEDLIEDQGGDFPRSESWSSEEAYNSARCIPRRWQCPNLNCRRTYEKMWFLNSERIILETATCENWFRSILNEQQETFRHLRAQPIVTGEGRNQRHQDHDAEKDCKRCTAEWECWNPFGGIRPHKHNSPRKRTI
jgi:hypothetical protein